MTAQEQHITVEKTARYYMLGGPAADTRELWLCCHGYGQLAGRFITNFQSIAQARRVIVAPEALQRFYLDPPDLPAAQRRVGATWMTREARETDIADYTRYLDTLCTHLLAQLPAGVKLIALGFSQGTATVARWAAATAQPISRLVLWGAGLPPDLDWTQAAAKLQRIPVSLVAGATDEMVSLAHLREQEALLATYAIAFQTTIFAGGHHLDATTLRRLAGD